MSPFPSELPGYLPGRWKIDPVNSEVGFSVRYLGVSRIHGRVKDVAGTVVTGDRLEQSSMAASVSANSVDTGLPARDTFLRGDAVLDVAEHEDLSFNSTHIRTADGAILVDGDIAIHAVTRPITLRVESVGFGEDPIDSGQVLGLSATTTLLRSDFGFADTLASHLVGQDITVQLDIHAVLAH